MITQYLAQSADSHNWGWGMFMMLLLLFITVVAVVIVIREALWHRSRKRKMK